MLTDLLGQPIRPISKVQAVREIGSISEGHAREEFYLDLLNFKDEANRLPRNVGKKLPNYVVGPKVSGLTNFLR